MKYLLTCPRVIRNLVVSYAIEPDNGHSSLTGGPSSSPATPPVSARPVSEPAPVRNTSNEESIVEELSGYHKKYSHARNFHFRACQNFAASGVKIDRPAPNEYWVQCTACVAAFEKNQTADEPKVMRSQSRTLDRHLQNCRNFDNDKFTWKSSAPRKRPITDGDEQHWEPYADNNNNNTSMGIMSPLADTAPSGQQQGDNTESSTDSYFSHVRNENDGEDTATTIPSEPSSSTKKLKRSSIDLVFADASSANTGWHTHKRNSFFTRVRNDSAEEVKRERPNISSYWVQCNHCRVAHDNGQRSKPADILNGHCKTLDRHIQNCIYIDSSLMTWKSTAPRKSESEKIHSSRLRNRNPIIAVFSGSARSGSMNTKLATTAANYARSLGAKTKFIDLSSYELPIYNQDGESSYGIPATAVKLKASLREADGWIVASPEYNGFVTPLLLNAFTWCSRGDPKGSLYATFKGKSAIILSASPGALGGMRGLDPHRTLLQNLGVNVLPTSLAVGRALKAFDEETGELIDQKQRHTLECAVRNLFCTVKDQAHREASGHHVHIQTLGEYGSVNVSD